MEVLHQRVIVRIDRQHGDAQNLSAIWRYPALPKTSDSHR